MHRRQALTKLSEVTMAVSKAATVSLWEDAVWLLEGAKQAPRMQPDMILYGAVMSACERARQWRRALAAFVEAKAQGLEPGLVATSIAITAYGRGALWEKSIEALRQLSDNDLQPNQITYNATISACERGQQSRPALALLCEMPEVAVPPDLISFNAAINACEKASDWQAALEVFMATPHGLPNEITYNTTISACHKGSHWQGALDLFCSMELRALAPNVITHSATMASCLRGDAWQKALEMYGRLPVVEREGNPILVGLMLQALGAAKAWGEAVAHIERLAKPGSRAVDALCFTAAVRTCGACGEWEWAMYLMDKMQGQGFLPDVVTATLVLSACRQSGQWQTALGILREKMPSLGVEPSNSSIKTVLAACFEANQLPAGLELLKESPLLRDSAECSRALTHVASAQVWEEALWITAHMLEHGLELSPGVQLRQVPQLAQLAVSSAPHAPPPPRPQRPPPPVRRTEDEKAVGDVEEQGQQEETQTMPSMAVKAAEPDQQEEQRELSYRLTDSGAALIDLHGLPVEVAKIAVQVALEDLLLGPPTGKSPAKELSDFIIVTGVGNNSPGGIAVVRPAVIALLREELQIRVLETRTDGPGRLRVPASELRKLRGVPKPTSLDLSRAAFQALTTPPAATATMDGSKPASETSGNAASKKGDYKEAITICQPFKDKYDKCFDVWYRQGFLRHQLNNPCDPEFEDYRACILEELAARGLRLPGSR
ncbi:unnamed protein product [Symbiodinium necroappetens]|uniref:Smr domain-containing protein n=1 Tax=Symbiodinium necroappetens TaxID=1628268 RepID=A0A813CIR3_9DINO|nr:unnamed protein product [Symbiodinium necroappetens]